MSLLLLVVRNFHQNQTSIVGHMYIVYHIPIIHTPIPMQVSSSPAADRHTGSRTTPSLNPFTTSLPSPLASSLIHTLSLSGGPGSLGSGVALTSSLIASVDGRSRQGLKETTVQYCLRIIDQSERSEIMM